jgi:hypothetical protein
MYDDSYPTPSAQEHQFHDENSSDEDEDGGGSSDDESSGGLLHFPGVEMTLDDESSVDWHDALDDAEEEVFINHPQSVTSLRKEPLENYQCPSDPPSAGPVLHTLTLCQELSLQHYVAWKQSNGTVKAFNLHVAVLRCATGQDILSLHSCQKLAMHLTELEPHQVDICPNTCIAYTGEYRDLAVCPYMRDGKKVWIPQYKPKKGRSLREKPQAQMLCLPVMATIKAM